MPSTATCWSSIRACVARITKLDECGRPLPAETDCGFLVTDGFVTIQYSPELAEGQEIELRNACGNLMVSEKGCDEIKWISVAIGFGKVDPDAVSMISNYQAVLDSAGNAVGNRISQSVDCTGGWALEAWSQVPGAACDAGSGKPYGYFLAPFIGPGTLGEFTLENGSATFTYTGRTRVGSGWDVGPWDVDANETAGTPGPLLTPIGPKDHLDMHLTTVPPPEASCGCQPMPTAV